MQLIYRVEHRSTGVGPFQTNLPFTQGLAFRAVNDPELRNPNDDGLLPSMMPWDWVFGAPSLEALKRWALLGFSIEENEAIVAKLSELGFVLSEYVVEEGQFRTGASGLQVAFDAQSCKQEGLVEQRDLRELLEQSPLVFANIRYKDEMDELWN